MIISAKRSFTFHGVIICVASCNFLLACGDKVKESTNVKSLSQQVTYNPGGYYKDIDLFHLKGQGEIRTQSAYPCIQIEHVSGSEKRITYFESKEVHYTKDYKQHGNYWMYKDISDGDTSVDVSIGYILPTEIIEFYYYTNDTMKDTLLNFVTVLNRAGMHSYYLTDAMKVAPDLSKLNYIKSRADEKIGEEITISRGILTDKATRKKANGMIVQKNIDCYNIGDHSFFWWYFFRGLSQPVKCP